MFYNLLLWLLYPLFWTASHFRPPASKTLVIQNAKIGDYVNASILFNAHPAQDVLISSVNQAFAKHDSRIQAIFVFEDYRGSLLEKLKLATTLFLRHYENIYLLSPNALSLFLVQCAMPKHKATLLTYATKRYEKSLMRGFKIVKHSKDDLTLDSYWSLTSLPRPKSYQKSPFEPCYQPKPSPLTNPKAFKIALSLGAGNRIKNIDTQTWIKMLKIFEKFPSELHLMGTAKDEEIWSEITRFFSPNLPVISMLGKLKLEEVPSYLKEMQLHVSSDSGNAYIADCYDVAIILLAGPCCAKEQKPITEKTLIIDSNSPLSPFSFVFNTATSTKNQDLFKINISQEQNIHDFVTKLYKDFQSSLSSL
ncbi:MAG: glycosyltransferase family 9 protein [Wolinella sp.]